MGQITIIAAIVFGLLLSHGGAFKYGRDVGTTSERTKWQTEIGAANAAHQLEIAAANERLRLSDEAGAAKLSAKDTELKAISDELQQAQKAEPLPDACAVCRIPRSHVERVRQGTATSDHPAAQSRPGSGATDAAKGTRQVPPRWQAAVQRP